MVDLVAERSAVTGAGVQGAGPLQGALGYLRANRANLAGEIVANFVLPYVIYDHAKPALGDVGALLASSGPPIVWSLVEFARRRKVDALSMLVLGGIALSVLAVLAAGRSISWSFARSSSPR